MDKNAHSRWDLVLKESEKGRQEYECRVRDHLSLSTSVGCKSGKNRRGDRKDGKWGIGQEKGHIVCG